MQTRVTQVENKLQDVKSRFDSLREEQESLSRDNHKLKEQMKTISKAHKEQEVLIGSYDDLVLCKPFFLFCTLNMHHLYH